MSKNHRLRAIQLKQWKRPETIRRELRALGAANSCRWWRNSGMLLNMVLDAAHFDKLGVPRLS